MKWNSPPSRREILLILFSVTVYLFAYNLETSLDFVGIDTVATQGAVLRRLGLGQTKVLGRDGLKPPGWRDRLESEIYGGWGWDEGHPARDISQRSQPKGSGRHGAQWMERRSVAKLKDEPMESNHKPLQMWGDAVPLATVVKHVPGYTILDNAIIFNGTVYLVSEGDESIPPLKNVVRTKGEFGGIWKAVSKEEGSQVIGKYGGFVRGVSWMSTETTFHNSTLFDLWRLYSTLDPEIGADGHTVLPPPTRLIFPYLPTFTDEAPHILKHWIQRRRVDTGVHPYLVKAAFPQLEMQYLEDWLDFHQMEVPFVLERLVIADREAASESVSNGQPLNSPPFGLSTSQHWWEPIRRTLAVYFDRLHEEEALAGNESSGIWSLSKSKLVVTYLDHQIEGGRNGQGILVPEDQDRLVRALRKMARDNGYEFHVVSTSLDETSWSERMDVVVRSTIVVGVHGDHLLDGIWMRPSRKSTLMELFSPSGFSLDRELLARAVGIRYVAWQGGSRFSGETLPQATKVSNDAVSVDTDAIVKEIRSILKG